MNAVEPPHGSAEGRNSNAARAANTGGGWHRNNPVLVKAGWRSDTSSHRFQNCRIAPEFQAPSRDDGEIFRRMPVAPVRSLNERG